MLSPVVNIYMGAITFYSDPLWAERGTVLYIVWVGELRLFQLPETTPSGPIVECLPGVREVMGKHLHDFYHVDDSLIKTWDTG